MSARPELTPVTISLPDPSRPPLRANVFDTLARANTALAPLFPYLGAGCIVPTGAVFRAGPGREVGAFEHLNTVDEVVICFAAQGCRIRLGQVSTGPKRHRVGAYFANPEDTSSFLLVTVTQRQAEPDEAQSESVSFFCANCQEPLELHTFDSKPQVEPGVMPPGYELFLHTIVESAKAVERLNGDAARRKCPKCSHENAPFPVASWGWPTFREHLGIVRDGWRDYVAAITGR